MVILGVRMWSDISLELTFILRSFIYETKKLQPKMREFLYSTLIALLFPSEEFVSIYRFDILDTGLQAIRLKT